jgi:hypothetical protein
LLKSIAAAAESFGKGKKKVNKIFPSPTSHFPFAPLERLPNQWDPVGFPSPSLPIVQSYLPAIPPLSPRTPAACLGCTPPSSSSIPLKLRIRLSAALSFTAKTKLP